MTTKVPSLPVSASAEVIAPATVDRRQVREIVAEHDRAAVRAIGPPALLGVAALIELGIADLLGFSLSPWVAGAAFAIHFVTGIGVSLVGELRLARRFSLPADRFDRILALAQAHQTEYAHLPADERYDRITDAVLESLDKDPRAQDRLLGIPD